MPNTVTFVPGTPDLGEIEMDGAAKTDRGNSAVPSAENIKIQMID